MPLPEGSLPNKATQWANYQAKQQKAMSEVTRHWMFLGLDHVQVVLAADYEAVVARDEQRYQETIRLYKQIDELNVKLAAADKRLKEYDHWTPDGSIEHWLAEREAQLAAVKEERDQ